MLMLDMSGIRPGISGSTGGIWAPAPICIAFWALSLAFLNSPMRRVPPARNVPASYADSSTAYSGGPELLPSASNVDCRGTQTARRDLLGVPAVIVNACDDRVADVAV